MEFVSPLEPNKSLSTFLELTVSLFGKGWLEGLEVKNQGIKHPGTSFIALNKGPACNRLKY